MILADTCPTCGGWMLFPNTHRCAPEFIVWRPDYDQTEDDGCTLRAVDAATAAEKWADWEDTRSAEYAIVNGSEATVHVRAVGSDTVETFVVRGEAVPSYTATRKMGGAK